MSEPKLVKRKIVIEVEYEDNNEHGPIASETLTRCLWTSIEYDNLLTNGYRDVAVFNWRAEVQSEDGMVLAEVSGSDG